MYMDYIDYDKDFVFMTDKSGNLTGGGFKIQSELLHKTMNGASDSNIQSGGTRSILNSFKDLVVPSGLYCQDTAHQKDYTIKYNHNSQQVDDTLYNRLLDLVSPIKRKLHDNKTRRKRESNKSKSKSKSKRQ